MHRDGWGQEGPGQEGLAVLGAERLHPRQPEPPGGQRAIQLGPFLPRPWAFHFHFSRDFRLTHAIRLRCCFLFDISTPAPQGVGGRNKPPSVEDTEKCIIFIKKKHWLNSIHGQITSQPLPQVNNDLPKKWNAFYRGSRKPDSREVPQSLR